MLPINIISRLRGLEPVTFYLHSVMLFKLLGKNHVFITVK